MHCRPSRINSSAGGVKLWLLDFRRVKIGIPKSVLLRKQQVIIVVVTMAAAPSTAGAAESSKSPTNPTVDSYIGSLISLTSKSEIRYEGVLFSIDTQESSIGLRNVRSFGTEGRKKDGPQVPPNDRLYEYILFRGSDIKDLQVKAPPSVQSTPIQSTTIHSDPAIIQSHNPQPAATSANPPSGGSGTISDVSSHMPQLGQQRPALQGSLPIYQTGGSLGSWGSIAPPPSANNSGLTVPLYWQGYYPPAASFPHLQPPHLLHPPPGLQIPPPMQQPLQYPGMTTNFPTGQPNLSNFPTPLLATAASSVSSASNMFPSTASQSLSSSLPLESSQVPLENKTTPTSLPVPNAGSNVPVGPRFPTVTESLATMTESMPSIGISNTRALNLVSQTSFQPIIEGSSRPSHIENTVPLLTPGELIQPGPSALASSFSLVSNKDAGLQPQEARSEASAQNNPLLRIEEAKPEASVLQGSSHATTGSKESILPLPKPTSQKPNGAPLHAYQYYRGRGRGRRDGQFQRPLTKFTEDFDFTAMNEKFNKDEVWGHLGKSKTLAGDMEGELKEDEDVDALYEDDADTNKLQKQPVYVKDDFFDSLSCDSLDRGSKTGRPKFSEQLKIDTETFGNFPRHRPNRGGGYAYRGGQGRTSYYGRGYGGRGRGHTSSYRPQSREI